MGIEPTRDSCKPHTGFEDQGRHQAPVASAMVFWNVGGKRSVTTTLINRQIKNGQLSLVMDTMTRNYFTHVGHNAGGLPL